MKASSMTATPLKSSKTKASSMTTTPLKSSKHGFEVKNEFKDDHAFEEFEDESKFNTTTTSNSSNFENEFDRVRKSNRLIFIYYKSEVSGRSGPEIQTRPTPRIDCWDFQLCKAKSLKKVNKSEVFIYLKFVIYLEAV